MPVQPILTQISVDFTSFPMTATQTAILNSWGYPQSHCGLINIELQVPVSHVLQLSLDSKLMLIGQKRVGSTNQRRVSTNVPNSKKANFKLSKHACIKRFLPRESLFSPKNSAINHSICTIIGRGMSVDILRSTMSNLGAKASFRANFM